MEKIKTGLWKTQDGRIIPIESMSDDHLKNAIKYLKERFFISNTKPGMHPSKYICDSYDYMIKVRKERSVIEKNIKKSIRKHNKEINILALI